MRLVQYTNDNGSVTCGIVEDPETVRVLTSIYSILDLAKQAIKKQTSLKATALALSSNQTLEYQTLLDHGRIMPPILHPDPAHLMVSGTGLTHLGSADTRAAMHAKSNKITEENSKKNPAEQTDSMKMFQMGLKGGKPSAGKTGVQPEWFYKGDGDIIAATEADLESPSFALDGGEEPEIAGIYVINDSGTPCRIGFCLGNEFSDHVTERQNYLYLAHSKLRPCALGPELLLGDLPKNITGHSQILRKDNNSQTTVIWEKEFLSGEENMSHTIANLEAHHFKYANFLRPGDVHVHFFGTGTLSFGDGVKTQAGDIFKIQSRTFGRPLQNRLVISEQNQLNPLSTINSL